MNIGKKSLLVATLAGVLAAPAVARAEDEKGGAKGDEGVPCWGVNKCKGVGDCGAGGCRTTGCHGSNACRGKGFLRLDKETCLKIQGGRLTQAAAKKPATKPEATKS
jgi:hypothetical protein